MQLGLVLRVGSAPRLLGPQQPGLVGGAKCRSIKEPGAPPAAPSAGTATLTEGCDPERCASSPDGSLVRMLYTHSSDELPNAGAVTPRVG